GATGVGWRGTSGGRGIILKHGAGAPLGFVVAPSGTMGDRTMPTGWVWNGVRDIAGNPIDVARCCGFPGVATTGGRGAVGSVATGSEPLLFAGASTAGVGAAACGPLLFAGVPGAGVPPDLAAA